MTRPLHRSQLAIAFGQIALGACLAAFAAAVPGTAPATVTGNVAAPVATAPIAPGEAAARKAMTAMAPAVKIDSVRPSPITGFMEVNTDRETVYVSNDGKYLFSGNLIDVASKRNLTEDARAVARRGALKAITASQMIVFAPSHPKYTVTVFTDVDCGFCRKMHSQINDYNRAGIAVDYLFFPRTGIGGESYDKAVSVWCAADRREAFTNAKKGLSVPKVNCANPVTMDYNLGLHVGVDGTPAIYAADGTQIGGYLSPTEMRTKLDSLAAKPNS